MNPLWSILIPTVMWREAKFLALVHDLLAQCSEAPCPVEVIGLQNVGHQSLARYRQLLLEDARGTYVSFVDDDDTVSSEFVKEITAAMATGPDVVGFLQECSGLSTDLTILSLRIQDRPDPGVVSTHYGPAYVRPFSHMCPVRRELALKGSFMANGELYSGEDTTYVESVLPYLRERGNNEVFIDKRLYHYRWSPSDTTQNRGSAPTGLISRFAAHRTPFISHQSFRWCRPHDPS